MIASPEDLLGHIHLLEEEISKLKQMMRAPRPEQGTAPYFPIDLLVFRVKELMFGLQVELTEEVIQMVRVSPLPRAPAGVRGTVNRRGHLVSVLDLVPALYGKDRPLTPDLFLVFCGGEQVFSLVVDEVLNVQQFHAADMDAAVAMSLPGFVRCLLRFDNQALALLEPSALVVAGQMDRLSNSLTDLVRGTEEHHR